MTVHMLHGDQAVTQLANKAFLERWQNLYENCPWATAFQSPGFVTTWFRVYGERFSPVILSDSSAEGQMNGLLMLGLSNDLPRLARWWRAGKVRIRKSTSCGHTGCRSHRGQRTSAHTHAALVSGTAHARRGLRRVSPCPTAAERSYRVY